MKQPAVQEPAVYLSVQHPDRQIQICGKTEPEDVRQLQLTRPGDAALKTHCRQYHKQQEKQQPEKTEHECAETEKENGPQKIDEQLDPVEKQSISSFAAAAERDARGRNPHQDVQDRPYDRE